MTLEELLRLRDALVFEMNTWDEILAMAKTPGIKEHARAAKEHCSRQLGQVEAEHAFRLSSRQVSLGSGHRPGRRCRCILAGC